MPHEQPLIDTFGVVEVIAWQRAHEFAGIIRVKAQGADLRLDGRFGIAALRGERNSDGAGDSGAGPAATGGGGAAAVAAGIASTAAPRDLRLPVVRW